MKRQTAAVTGILMFLAAAAPICVGRDRTRVRTEKSDDGWRLLVNETPYFVKGVCYTPALRGESPDDATLRDWMTIDDNNDGINDLAYQTWVDSNQNGRRDPEEPVVGDFALLKDLGCNTIRLYHHATPDPAVQKINASGMSAALMYNHPPNKDLLRDLFNTYGIRVAMGDLLGAYCVGSGAAWEAGTDYTNPAQRKNMLKSVEAMVREFKDEPFLLMWVLGNENNYPDQTRTNARSKTKAYASFVDQAARRIKEMDPHHPVCLANGETELLYAYAKYAPTVDIFGLNSYRQPTFGNLWDTVARTFDRPVLLTEYGAAQPIALKQGNVDEARQASELVGAYCDMRRHAAGGRSPGNSIGGFVFEWVDNWWQDGDSGRHDLGRKGWHLEWNGIAAQVEEPGAELGRRLRQAYYELRPIWTKEGDECEKTK